MQTCDGNEIFFEIEIEIGIAIGIGIDESMSLT
jgi:hypothetical protein